MSFEEKNEEESNWEIEFEGWDDCTPNCTYLESLGIDISKLSKEQKHELIRLFMSVLLGRR